MRLIATAHAMASVHPFEHAAPNGQVHGRAGRSIAIGPQLLLRATAPKPRVGEIPREKLLRRFAEVRERAVVLVQAPEGFGKTALLAQMRRAWLACGASVAWLSAEPDDTPGEIVDGIEAAIALSRPEAEPYASRNCSRRSRCGPRRRC
jgi:LuxR family maltose regulon positive regulatory protein